MNVSDPCFSTSSDMMTVDEAINFMLDKAEVLKRIEHIDTDKALKRVLASPLVSKVNVPPLDNSAMDGYAINTRDCVINGVTHLSISQRIPAGSIGRSLESGTAARIFTGAPVPKNANAVVIQENVKKEAGYIQFECATKAGDNIRKAGEDISVDEEILDSGIRLRPQELGLAASTGFAQLPVYKKLRIAIFSTGDELVAPGEELDNGKIYNSNRYTLTGLLASLDCDIVDLGTVPDQLEATINTLNAAAKQADLIIATGGVSVGEEDYIKAALDKLGQIDMWRINMKPGKPLAFGHVDNTPFIGLPGNPVSVFVTFCLFARPYLLKTQGASNIMPKQLIVKAGFDWNQTGPRREYVRARLMPGTNVVEIYPKQGSGVLSSVVWAEGLVEIPENSTIKKGDDVSYLSFADLLS